MEAPAEYLFIIIMAYRAAVAAIAPSRSLPYRPRYQGEESSGRNHGGAAQRAAGCTLRGRRHNTQQEKGRSGRSTVKVVVGLGQFRWLLQREGFEIKHDERKEKKKNRKEKKEKSRLAFWGE